MIFFFYLAITFIIYSVTAQKPHVIFIVADDLGWNDIGFHGSNQIPTPNIDALAYSGIILHNYYTLPICSPSRSALMTGMHPIHTGMHHRVILAPEPWGLPLNQKILPQYLKEDGYKTHAVGKWHLGFFESSYTPLKRGFDSHFGYWTGRHDYFDHTAEVTKMWGYDMRRGQNVSWESRGSYTTDLLTSEAVDVIHKHDPLSPLFLYVAHLAVHSANEYAFLQAPAEVIKKFEYIKDKERRTFAAMVWKLDESVGKIISALGERNMLNNTLIVFTTDNGGAAAGFNHNAASNWPLRGVKDTLWEGGVRGVGFVWGSMLPASRINNQLIHIQDWLSTVLSAVRSSSKTENTRVVQVDGHDMWPVLKEEKFGVYNEILLNIDPIRNISAFRKGDWKIISGDAYSGKWNDRYGPNGRDNVFHYDINVIFSSYVATTFRKNNISLPSIKKINELRKNVSVACGIENQEKACNLKLSTCLFNIKKDPCEIRNVADENPQILKKLQLLMNQYKPVKELNKPPDPRSDPKNWNNTWTNWMDYDLILHRKVS